MKTKNDLARKINEIESDIARYEAKEFLSEDEMIEHAELCGSLSALSWAMSDKWGREGWRL